MSLVQGTVASGFEAVRTAFAKNWTDRGEVGAACAAYVDGRKVVDLWGGSAAPGRPWQQDTLGLIWSSTKGATALCAQILVDQGRLDLDLPVAAYWPEFGTNGKEAITTRHILTHSAGLPYWEGYRDVVTMTDPASFTNTDEIVTALASAAPLWKPGSAFGYHAVTFGWLVGKVVQQVSGVTLGQFFRTNVAEPLGLDFWIGLPVEHHHRVADLLPAPPLDDPAIAAIVEAMMGPNAMTGQALLVDAAGGTSRVHDTANDAAFRTCEIPAANGICDARSLARLYAMLAGGGEIDGTRIVSAESVRAHSAEQITGDDLVLVSPKRFALGYMRPCPPTEVFGPNDGAFGHPGMGGSLGFADPTARVGFGYVMNQMMPGIQVDPRPTALADALYGCL